MKLELFKKETCPYCQKVMKFISSTGRTDIIYRDVVESEEADNTLFSVTGKHQVPCLFIDGTPMFESQDIIDWLGAHPAID